MQQTVYYIQGDGIGPEIWHVTQTVVDAALQKVYDGAKTLQWEQLLAGEAALAETGELLPQETLTTLSKARYAIKGPLNTPVGKGFRSLNVTLRQSLDLYACIRPIRHYPGVVSPVKHPELIDTVVFRENTEDLYLGIEFQSQSAEAKKLIEFLHDTLHITIDASAGIGLKPMTPKGSKRLVRKAIEYALASKRPSVTLMHKGNIMKFTEGGFREWGYEVAQEEFAGQYRLESDAQDKAPLLLKDRIADALFQEVLLYPQNYSVIATPNLNGDYISDALAAQVGGLGMAPGVNKSDTLSFYEATHGTAPAIAGQDKANPCSLLLSAKMMLEEMGYTEAAERIETAILHAFTNRTVTVDLANQMENARTVGCQEFGEIILGSL